jgi:hypothetical protein
MPEVFFSLLKNKQLPLVSLFSDTNCVLPVQPTGRSRNDTTMPSTCWPQVAVPESINFFTLPSLPLIYRPCRCIWCSQHLQRIHLLILGIIATFCVSQNESFVLGHLIGSNCLSYNLWLVCLPVAMSTGSVCQCHL